MRTLKLIGKKFGRLTVMSLAPSIQGQGKSRWNCRCECGKETVVIGSNLGVHTLSCGCLQADLAPMRGVKHGHGGDKDGNNKSREYNSWCSMKQRCFYTKYKRWKDYGGRGITVCDQWRYDFAKFLSDMGPRPENTSLERINNDGNYEPSNCRWATTKEQAKNKRKNKLYTTNTSGEAGVSYVKQRNKWEAYISVDCEHIHIGRFDTKEEAIEARKKFDEAKNSKLLGSQ